MSKRVRTSESKTPDKRTRLATQTIAFAYGGSLDCKVNEPPRLRGAFLSKREACLLLSDLLATNTLDPETPPVDLRPPGPGQPIDEDAMERLSETSSIVLRVHADVDLTEVVDGARAERVVPASVGDRVLAVVCTWTGAGDFHFGVDASFLVRSKDEADLAAARQSATRHALATMGSEVVSAFRRLALAAETEQMTSALEQIEERTGGFGSHSADRAWETVSVLPEGIRQAIRNLADTCKDPNTADESLLETIHALMRGSALVATVGDDDDDAYYRADVVDVVIGRYPSASGAGGKGTTPTPRSENRPACDV